MYMSGKSRVILNQCTERNMQRQPCAWSLWRSIKENPEWMNSMHLIRGGRPSWCAQEEKLKQFDQGGYTANGNDHHRSQLNNEPIFQFSKISFCCNVRFKMSFTKSLGNRFRFWYTRFPQRRINLWVSQVMVGICKCLPWIILWKKWASCDISYPITAKKFAGNECKEFWMTQE